MHVFFCSNRSSICDDVLVYPATHFFTWPIEILSIYASTFLLRIECRLMLIDVDWCWLMLIDADWCWLMLSDSDWCWLMLTDVCWRWFWFWCWFQFCNLGYSPKIPFFSTAPLIAAEASSISFASSFVVGHFSGRASGRMSMGIVGRRQCNNAWLIPLWWEIVRLVESGTLSPDKSN